MKKVIVLFAIIAISFLLVGCGPNTLRPEGELVSRSQEVETFNAISIGGVFNVTFQHGTETSVVLYVQDNLYEITEISVSNNVLNIRIRSGYGITMAASTPRPRIYITAPTLTSAILSGQTTSTIEVEESSFTLTASGQSRVTLTGSAPTLTVTASGQSDVSAFGLGSANATVTASGQSNVNVNATQILAGTASGQSRVTHQGNPTVTITTSGQARVQAYS